MKELSRKTFATILGILSAFLVISLVIMNAQSYRKELESVKRNLNFIEDRGFRPGGFEDGKQDEFGAPEGEEPAAPEGEEPRDLENMMIMDYEVYTVEIEEGSIARVINHGSTSADFDAESIASDIMNNNSSDTLKIGNLYTSDYSYNYRVGDSIVIINNSDISSKLRRLLYNTIIAFICIEGFLFYISSVISRWITKPAREAFDRQKEFIADASHELKTPLAVIMASSDEIKTDEENSKYIENIKYESDRMNKLISGLLDLSKLEEGVSKDSYKEENLSKIVEKTCLVFEGVAFEQGVAIETAIEEGIKLTCSKEEIEKLVSTVLDNAIKHSDKSSTVIVKLSKNAARKNTNNEKESGSKGRASTILKITNTGEPIKSGDEEKIFERFYRADQSRNRSDNRYGLGLAIAKRIVQNHGGTITAKSVDRTTTFTIKM